MGSLPLSSAGSITDPAFINTDMLAVACVFFLLVSVGLAVNRYFLGKKLKALKKYGANLEKSRDKYRLIAENAEEGILIVQHFKFKYANSKVYEMMGLNKTEQVSETLTDYIYPDDLGLMLEQYESTILSENSARGFTIRVVKADKEVIWVQARTIHVSYRGEPANLVFMQDVSLLKDMEQDLQQAQRLEAIGALSGGIAHDFNNILTTIIGNAELALMDMESNDPCAEEFRQIQSSGYRARELVRQILTLSRSHAREAAPLSLAPVIKEAVKLLRSTLPIHMRVEDTIDEASGMILADVTRVYQVFMNLCTNAKHAMEKVEAPVLEIGLDAVFLDRPLEPKQGSGAPARILQPGRYLKLVVADNGTGIDPDIRDRIFEPYFSTKPPGTGTGLGLAASLEIVHDGDGDIICEDRSERGTRFIVYFPEYEEEPLPNTAWGDEAPTMAKGKGTLLFVDDEKEITSIAERLFENLGYDVVTAGSGRQALDIFTRDPNRFDLVITDMGMPGMTGDQLVAQISRIRSDLPLILCTGYSETCDEATARHTGVAEYIYKPYSLKSLAALAGKYTSS